jgi:ferredoxin
MIYQDNVEGLAVWLPWDAGETEILAIRDASPVMRQILAELSRQLLVATTYHQGPRAADQPSACRHLYQHVSDHADRYCVHCGACVVVCRSCGLERDPMESPACPDCTAADQQCYLIARGEDCPLHSTTDQQSGSLAGKGPIITWYDDGSITITDNPSAKATPDR